jgi:hypothetical protein
MLTPLLLYLTASFMHVRMLHLWQKHIQATPANSKTLCLAACCLQLLLTCCPAAPIVPLQPATSPWVTTVGAVQQARTAPDATPQLVGMIAPLGSGLTSSGMYSIPDLLATTLQSSCGFFSSSQVVMC